MKWKKYVKGILAALFTVLGVILVIVLGLKFLRFFMPFVIGWIIAMIASPLVRMVEKYYCEENKDAGYKKGDAAHRESPCKSLPPGCGE